MRCRSRCWYLSTTFRRVRDRRYIEIRLGDIWGLYLDVWGEVRDSCGERGVSCEGLKRKAWIPDDGEATGDCKDYLSNLD